MTEGKDQEAEQQLRHALDELLAERKQLLKVYCQAAAVNQKEDIQGHTRLFKRLCQLLMDYAALWQFEIHDVLLQSAAQHGAAVEALNTHQPAIQQAANVALDFNDLFDGVKLEKANPDLESRLSVLGESLANRFEAEDRIIINL
ncbi:Rsd/AlgQ family anti-sigma factor [Thiolapillus sp.]